METIEIFLFLQEISVSRHPVRGIFRFSAVYEAVNGPSWIVSYFLYIDQTLAIQDIQQIPVFTGLFDMYKHFKASPFFENAHILKPKRYYYNGFSLNARNKAVLASPISLIVPGGPGKISTWQNRAIKAG